MNRRDGKSTDARKHRCARRRVGGVLAALCGGMMAAAGGLRSAEGPPARPPTEEEIRLELVKEIERVRAARERQTQMVLARQKLQLKEFGAAADLLAPLIADQPEAGLYLDLGQAQIGLQQYAKARQSFTLALEQDGSLVAAKRGLGWLAFRAQDYTGALRWWEPLLQAGQRDAELLTRAGQCYYFTQQRRAALDCFDAAALGQPADTDLDRWRIFCAQDVGEFAQADRLARAVLARRGGDLPVRRIAARAAAALDRREDAILQLERLNLDGGMARDDWRLLGELYALTGDDSRAADCLETAIVTPAVSEGGETPAPLTTSATWLQLGGLQERAGRLARAVEVYGKIAADRPEAALAALGLARIAKQRGDAAETLRQGQAALKARADLTEAQLLLGWAQERQGETAAAAAAYAQAASTPRLAAEAHLGLARLAYLEGRLSAALEHYTAAADLRPADRALQGILRQLTAHLDAAAAAQ